MRRSAARLNGRQRRALVLREVEGRSYPEIAESMGISTDAVAHVLARARTRLRSEYRREQSPVPAVAAACAPIRDVLSTYLDGQVTAAVHDEVTEHLATCRDCREVLGTYREASFQLRGADAPLTAGIAARARRRPVPRHRAPHDRDGGNGRRQRRDRRRGQRRHRRRAPLRRAAAGRERRCRCAGRDHDRRSRRLPLAQRCDRVRRCRCSGRDVGDLRPARR